MVHCILCYFTIILTKILVTKTKQNRLHTVSLPLYTIHYCATDILLVQVLLSNIISCHSPPKTSGLAYRFLSITDISSQSGLKEFVPAIPVETNIPSYSLSMGSPFLPFTKFTYNSLLTTQYELATQTFPIHYSINFLLYM